MINKETTVTIRSARKIRTKTRRPKFLSLRLELSLENTQNSGDMTAAATTHHHHQLNLFPLHPENLVDEKDTHDENVHEFFFSAADGGATTLTGLLGAGTSSEEDNSLSPSLTYACGGQNRDSEEEGRRDLVRTALRNRERDSSEEKWVCYSEVTSCAADLRYKNEVKQSLSLKLDYQEIMDAWSDKGPLFIQLESPQTVPVLHDDCTPNGIMDGWGSNGGVWTVPENSFCGNVKMEKEQGLAIGIEGDQNQDQELKMVQREASVLRYKEKRQNRLFSKRIRYEVRKLNAEKRPRMKGRFVKRS